VIALSGGAANAFHNVDVLLGDNSVTLRFSYVTSSAAWAMDVIQDGVPLFAGVMLRINADMLSSWRVSETFGAMTLIGDDPTIDNLGSGCLLVWVPPDEL
jgi:hydrogenase maturation factor HypE